ncbi:hypothetical protein [Fischerella muscicola]
MADGRWQMVEGRWQKG